jgi:ETC complex I subunit-like protein
LYHVLITLHWDVACFSLAAHESDFLFLLLYLSSAGDSMYQNLLTFPTVESAIEFCEKEGWTYDVRPSEEDYHPEGDDNTYDQKFAYRGRVDVEDY